MIVLFCFFVLTWYTGPRKKAKCKNKKISSNGFLIFDFGRFSFGNAVGAMYVREFFEEDARKSANEMVKDIRSVFTEIIDELEWMDDETRIRAKEKAASMTTHIAYPDELLDDKKLTDLYENVRLSIVQLFIFLKDLLNSE